MIGSSLKTEEKQLFREDNISYRYLRPQYAKEVCQIIGDAMNQENLFSKAIAALSPDIEKEVIRGNKSLATEGIEEFCQNDLSVVAVDVQSGQVAGAFLVKKFSFLTEASEEELNSYFSKVIIAIVTQLMEETNHPVIAALEAKGTVMDLMALGVGKKFSGRKIANKLADLVISNGKEKGFKFLYSFVIDARSRHIFLKFGGKTLAKLKNYADFDLDGDKPLRYLDESSCPLEIMCKTFQ